MNHRKCSRWLTAAILAVAMLLNCCAALAEAAPAGDDAEAASTAEDDASISAMLHDPEQFVAVLNNAIYSDFEQFYDLLNSTSFSKDEYFTILLYLQYDSETPVEGSDEVIKRYKANTIELDMRGVPEGDRFSSVSSLVYRVSLDDDGSLFCAVLRGGHHSILCPGDVSFQG